MNALALAGNIISHAKTMYDKLAEKQVLQGKKIEQYAVVAYAQLTSSTPSAVAHLTSQFNTLALPSQKLIDKDDAFLAYAKSVEFVKGTVNAQGKINVAGSFPYSYPEILVFDTAATTAPWTESLQLIAFYNGTHQFKEGGNELTRKLDNQAFLRVPSRIETAAGRPENAIGDAAVVPILDELIFSGDKKENVEFIWPSDAVTNLISGADATAENNMIKLTLYGWNIRTASSMIDEIGPVCR